MHQKEKKIRKRQLEQITKNKQSSAPSMMHQKKAEKSKIDKE